MSTVGENHFGVLDNRFLARSVGLVNPKPPLLVEETDPLRVALEGLQNSKVGCLIVTAGNGTISGIFSERDAMLKVLLSDVNVDVALVSELMTPNPQTATMTTTIAFALSMMSQGGYRHIPIVDDSNYPVGMVSVKDIVDYIVGALVKDIISF